MRVVGGTRTETVKLSAVVVKGAGERKKPSLTPEERKAGFLKFMAGEINKPRGPCVHLGVHVRDQQCPTCAGHVRIKVMGCALHTECTLGKPLHGSACCARCPDWTNQRTETR